MDARSSLRKAQLLEECQGAPAVFAQVLPRLQTFMAPLVDPVQGQAPRAHAQTYVQGLLSDVERKNVESSAYHFGQDRLGLQGFIGWDAWDDAPLRQTLRSHVGPHVGHADGVLVFEPSAWPKAGRESVGVARQWCGRLGKVETATWPLTWARCPASARATRWSTCGSICPKHGPRRRRAWTKLVCPKPRAYRPRHQLVLAMLTGTWRLAAT